MITWFGMLSILFFYNNIGKCLCKKVALNHFVSQILLYFPCLDKDWKQFWNVTTYTRPSNSQTVLATVSASSENIENLNNKAKGGCALYERLKQPKKWALKLRGLGGEARDRQHKESDLWSESEISLKSFIRKKQQFLLIY